jgi:hypothetical protein
MYYYNISYCDIVGNCITNGTYNFTTSAPVVVQVSSSGGGGSGGSSNSPVQYILNTYESQNGAFKNIQTKDKIKFNLTDGEHTITLNKVDNNSVNLTVMSDPINMTLFIGQEAKINLTSIDYYDVYIKLLSIQNNKANLSVKIINESIIPNVLSNETSFKNDTNEERSSGTSDKEYKDNSIMFIIGIIFIVAVVLIIVLILFRKFNSNQKKNKK